MRTQLTADDETLWLHVDSPSGKKASLNLMADRYGYGPIVRSVLHEIREELLRRADGVAQEDARAILARIDGEVSSRGIDKA